MSPAFELSRVNPLRIALVNNMPDQAVEATRAQFARLVRAGAQDMPFTLRCYALPSVNRSDTARRAMAQTHEPIGALYARGADALIVTGAEPRATKICDEDYFEDFAALVDWARTQTLGAVWSCLAAHGAVFKLSGLRRRREKEKISGVFAFNVAKDDWIGLGAANVVRTPHSRYNGLAREALELAGYRVSSASREIGVDSFWRREPSLFLFTQGHPEYDADTLLREFRRDALRFVKGESESFPRAPANYFSNELAKRIADLAPLRKNSCRRRDSRSN